MKDSKASTVESNKAFDTTEFQLPTEPQAVSPIQSAAPVAPLAKNPADWKAEQIACRLIAKLTGQFADLAETVTHTHGAPQERTRLLDVIREAGTVGKAAFKSKIIWGGYHVDPAEALKCLAVLKEELLTLEGALIEAKQLAEQKPESA